MDNIIERKHRLSRECYTGRAVIAFTLCVHNRLPLFSGPDIFPEFETILLETLKKYRVQAHVYLFMPEHVHLLLAGEDPDSDLWKSLVEFKQRSGYRLSRAGRKERWQKDFYDHILRGNEDIKRQVRYILGNPIRRGLVEHWKQYPLKGSTMYTFAEW